MTWAGRGRIILLLLLHVIIKLAPIHACTLTHQPAGNAICYSGGNPTCNGSLISTGISSIHDCCFINPNGGNYLPSSGVCTACKYTINIEVNIECGIVTRGT